jgi:uncharacterized protein
MATTMSPIRTTDVLEGLRIIDCDSHFTEPPDLWTSRAPAALKDRVPVQRTIDGRTAWFLDGEVWASIGGNTIRSGREKVLGAHVVQPFEAIDEAAYGPKERLALLDEMGIYAQVIYPNGIGFASNHVFAIKDNALRTAVLQMYNDFLVDVQQESGGRLLPQGLLPIWDMDLTIKEMTRLRDKGIHGFTLSDKPELLGLPELPQPYFDPMWDLFNDSGAVVNFHIGAGARKEELEAIRAMRFEDDPNRGGARSDPPTVADPYWRSFGHQRRLAAGASQMFMSNVRIVINLCLSDLFDRYPRLKVVSAESGIGWVPFMLESVEFQLAEMVTDPEELKLQQRKPSEYFRDHLYVMFWFEKLGPEKLIGDIGVHNVLIETDVPHPTCLYPGAKEHFAEVMGRLDPHVVRRVLQDNAAELYQIDLPATA